MNLKELSVLDQIKLSESVTPPCSSLLPKALPSHTPNQTFKASAISDFEPHALGSKQKVEIPSPESSGTFMHHLLNISGITDRIQQQSLSTAENHLDAQSECLQLLKHELTNKMVELADKVRTQDTWGFRKRVGACFLSATSICLGGAFVLAGDLKAGGCFVLSGISGLVAVASVDIRSNPYASASIALVGSSFAIAGSKFGDFGKISPDLEFCFSAIMATVKLVGVSVQALQAHAEYEIGQLRAEQAQTQQRTETRQKELHRNISDFEHTQKIVQNTAAISKALASYCRAIAIIQQPV